MGEFAGEKVFLAPHPSFVPLFPSHNWPIHTLADKRHTQCTMFIEQSLLSSLRRQCVVSKLSSLLADSARTILVDGNRPTQAIACRWTDRHTHRRTHRTDNPHVNSVHHLVPTPTPQANTRVLNLGVAIVIWDMAAFMRVRLSQLT